ncbi:natural cytotoxicity triggering receptor 2-like [Puntigrus tetrazona]|uniref:natural cytotoxicity triggering receptor 2-like n=1 Tax=Puntigrus tetrazona TaxID=1606681 RepID=UPI001C89452E|nr:natural cytotoxicity triggering receptor 2-like [Puntigrus tetrazona]
MKFLYVLGLFICLSAELGISATDKVDLHGYSGKGVTITCSHSWAATNIKYFCRHPCKDEDVLVKSDQSPEGRYTLKDHGDGTFTVNITDLQETDSGVYWCGVKRFGSDTFKKVNLIVSKASDTNRSTPTPKPAVSSQSFTTNGSFSTSSASGGITTPTSTGFKVPVVSSKPALRDSSAQASLSGPLMTAAISLTVMTIILGAVLCLWNKQKKNLRSSNVDAENQGTTNPTEIVGEYDEIPQTQQCTETHPSITIYSTVNKSKASNQIQEPPLYSTLLMTSKCQTGWTVDRIPMKMKTLHMLWNWIFLSGFRISATDQADLHGYSGKGITITCSHSWASTNIKYFCRDPCKDEDVLVKSDQSPKGRYTLKDHGDGTFTVNIIDLQETDSGVYWCGVERAGCDTFNKINLIVSKDPNESISTSTQPYKDIQTDSQTTTPGSPSTDDVTLSPTATALNSIKQEKYT